MKTTRKKNGGGCGCSGNSKLFMGGKRRQNKTYKKKRHARFKRNSKRVGKLGGNTNLPALNNYNNDPRTMLASEHYTTNISNSSSGGKKRKIRGGGLMQYLSDPLLGGTPNNLVLGFGSSAGTANSMDGLTGTNFSSTGVSNIQKMSTNMAPLV